MNTTEHKFGSLQIVLRLFATIIQYFEVNFWRKIDLVSLNNYYHEMLGIISCPLVFNLAEK